MRSWLNRKQRLTPWLWLIGFVPMIAAGCHSYGPTAQPGVVPVVMAPPPNPILVPDQDPAFLWNQIVDTVDDYFRVE